MKNQKWIGFKKPKFIGIDFDCKKPVYIESHNIIYVTWGISTWIKIAFVDACSCVFVQLFQIQIYFKKVVKCLNVVVCLFMQKCFTETEQRLAQHILLQMSNRIDLK